jgi:hypothetical protein
MCRTFIDCCKGFLIRRRHPAPMVRIVVSAMAAFAVFDLWFQNGMYTHAAAGTAVALVHRVVLGY